MNDYNEEDGMETTEGPGEPDREGFESEQSGGGETPHTSPEEGHPAGDGERTDRDVGGPTSPDDAEGDADETGAGPSKAPDGGFEPHE